MGRSSVSNRLLESIGQANRVLLNMAVDYNPIALARNVKSYFEKNPKAVEVLIFKGHKCISVLREDVQSKTFHKLNSFKMGSIDKALPSRGILPG